MLACQNDRLWLQEPRRVASADMIVHGTLERVKTVDCCLSSAVTYVCTVTVNEAPPDIKRI